MSTQNPEAFSITGDDLKPALYEWGRKYAVGRQQVVFIWAEGGKWPSGDKYIDVTVGARATGPGEEGLGCKIERRFNIPSDDWRGFLNAIEPAALKLAPGQVFTPDFKAWSGRSLSVDVYQEKDKNRSKDAGTDIFRPRFGKCEPVSSVPAPTRTGGML
jgi:hypothetical protein